MRLFLGICFLILHTACSFAQLLYPIVGTYNGYGAQGMAIYGDEAYLMSDGGFCRVYDLIQRKVVKEFSLASSAKNNHVNNACFGSDLYGDNNLPLVYISECNNLFRCFVEKIESRSCKLVQTIEKRQHGKVEVVIVWVVDARNKSLYSVTRTGTVIDEKGNCVCSIKRYDLPSINERSLIILTENDVIEQFDVIFPNILQGCKIRGRYMYLLTGFQQSLSGRKDAVRSLKIIDLKKKCLAKEIDLTYVTTNEPEDIDFYKGQCLMYCGQEGGLYSIPFK